MLMLEDEAREKWCPMVRAARRETVTDQGADLVVAAGCNTDALGRNRVPASCRCIGSQCAMWRWDGPVHNMRVWNRENVGESGVEPPRPSGVGPEWEFFDYRDEGGVCGWRESDAEAAKRRLGYCGIAGRPEVGL